MNARIPFAVALVLAAALGLAACGEGSVEQLDAVGSGNGPTEGTGAPSGRTTPDEARADGE